MPECDDHVTDEAIRVLSYMIWQLEGCPADRALDHWLRAKAELQGEGHSAIQKPPGVVEPRLPVSVRPQKRMSIRIRNRAA